MLCISFSKAPIRIDPSRVFNIFTPRLKLIRRDPLNEPKEGEHYDSIPANGNMIRIPINGIMRLVSDLDIVEVISKIEASAGKERGLIGKLSNLRGRISSGVSIDARTALYLAGILERYL